MVPLLAPSVLCRWHGEFLGSRGPRRRFYRRRGRHLCRRQLRIVQKYLHDMEGWNALPTEVQERIIGRTKLSDIELDDAVKPTSVHNALTTIVENGKENEDRSRQHAVRQRVRGRVRNLFHRLRRSPRTIEQMLENMFVGKPPGNYDRILDFSTARTGRYGSGRYGDSRNPNCNAVTRRFAWHRFPQRRFLS